MAVVVPVVLKLVEKVSTKLEVPLVVTMIDPDSPAVQLTALMVSAWAGVRVKTVAVLKSTETVVPGVRTAVPMPPLVMAQHPPFAVGRTPVTCVARLTTVIAASASSPSPITPTSAVRRIFTPQYHRQLSFEPVAGAVR